MYPNKPFCWDFYEISNAKAKALKVCSHYP